MMNFDYDFAVFDRHEKAAHGFPCAAIVDDILESVFQ